MATDGIKELVNIGDGPGEYSAAFKAADLGMKFTMVDPSAYLGGTCLYHGCIPSNTLLQFKHAIIATGSL